MLITDDLFSAFVRCETKSYNLSRATVGDSRTSHPLSDWQQDLAEHFRRECRDLLTSIDLARCFRGTPSRRALATGQHQYIIDPVLTFEDMVSHIDALERTHIYAQKSRLCAKVTESLHTCQVHRVRQNYQGAPTSFGI
jgi:hypothetical protein